MTHEHELLHKEMSEFVAVALTCKKRNTPEWMKYFAERINRALKALGTDDGVSYPGSWSNEFHLQSGGDS